MFNPTEKKLAAEMLELAYDQFGNHGCNDYDMSLVIPSQQERDDLYRAYCEWNGEPEEYYQSYPPDYRMMDFMLMGYLADRLREEL